MQSYASALPRMLESARLAARLGLSQLEAETLTLEERLATARSLAQDNLLDFCEWTTPWFVRARHLSFVAPFYEAIHDGVIDRLMFLTAPRHGKTELGLRHCARYLGENPSDQVIVASYNARIAGRFGGKVRNIVASEAYRDLCEPGYWGCSLQPDEKAKDAWATDAGGFFLATGVGGGSTGYGANGLLIDDFLKGRKDADSEVVREDIEQWYSGEAYPRLMPRNDGRPAWVVMEYTTWHESDLGQREIQAMLDGTGDNWWVVRLPAVAEDDDIMGRKAGEALWPERYPIDRLHRIKGVLDRLNPRDFVSLYQARPTAMEGTFFKRQMFPDLDRTGTTAHGRRRWYIVTDWGADGDPTAHGVIGVDSRLDAHVVDVWHERCDTGVGTEALLDLVQKWRPQEGGVAGWIHAKGPLDKGVRPLVALRSRQRNIVLPPEFEYAETADKQAMAGSIQGYMAAGRVRFDTRAQWFADLLRQCLAFPSGAHDEYVDVLKMFGLHLDAVVAPPVRRVEMVKVQGAY